MIFKHNSTIVNANENTTIVHVTLLECCFFANNSVIIASATMKLEQNLAGLTHYPIPRQLAYQTRFFCFPSEFVEISECSKDP